MDGAELNPKLNHEMEMNAESNDMLRQQHVPEDEILPDYEAEIDALGDVHFLGNADGEGEMKAELEWDTDGEIEAGSDGEFDSELDTGDAGDYSDSYAGG